MEIVSIERSSGTASVSLTVNELAFLVNSIGEALQAVDDWEFGSRLGAEPVEARSLRDGLSELIHAATPPQT